MNSKRLALFLPGLDSGGVSRVMLNLAHGLSRLGFEVDLVLASSQSPLESRIPLQVKIVKLTPDGRPGFLGRLIYKLTGLKYFAESVSGLWALVRYLRIVQPRALLSGTANVVAILAWKLSRVRTRLLVTAAVQQSKHFRQEFSGLRRLLPIVHNKIMRWADGAVAESEGVAADLIRTKVLSPRKIWIIHNPVMTPELLRGAQDEIHEPWLHPGEPPVILGAGRLEKQKDFPTLIKAFALLRSRRPARLIILGEGSQQPSLEALIAELGLENDCRLPGYKPNPYPYMARAAVFVLSSAWEGFGNVLAEALAVGTPVVSTDCESGPREILEGGTYGRLVPVGDIAAMATAMGETLDNPPAKAFLRQKGQEFSLERALPRFLEALKIDPPTNGS